MNTVYYHVFDEPIKYKDFKGNDAFKERELRCSDYRVERVWYYGCMSMSDDGTAFAYVSFQFKDGRRFENKLQTPDFETESSQFLETIK